MDHRHVFDAMSAIGARWRALRSTLCRRPGPAATTTVAAGVPEGPRSEGVDVIVCVHNARERVERCLASVVRTIHERDRLIIVDDGSDEKTRAFLEDLASRHGARLIAHEVARGYPRAANAGLRASTAPWAILLNSDTEVTAGWVDRMWAHGRRDGAIGLVGPLSNSAAWQSVPYLNAGGDWLSSRLPDGLTVDELGEIVRRFEHASIPLPFLNGFCYMIRRAVIEQIGLLDEDGFGAGYGEEHDFSIRAAAAGWTSVVAGDVYVFHAGSQSYGHAARRSLVERGERALRAKHGPSVDIGRRVERCRTSVPMAGVRARLASTLTRRGLVETGRARWRGRRVALVHVAGTSGSESAAMRREARALERMGVPVTVLALDPAGARRVDADPAMTVRDFGSRRDLHAHLAAERYDAVVVTSFSPAGRLPDRADVPETALAYHVHRLEPWLPPQHDDADAREFREHAETGAFTLLARTALLAEDVRSYTGRTPVVVAPSVDLDRFYPRGRQRRQDTRSDGVVVVSAMLDPGTPWRSGAATLAALERVVRRLHGRVEIHLFGAIPEELGRAGLRPPRARHHGPLSAAGVAAVLNDSDIVLDLTAELAVDAPVLEAMACGCAVVIGDRGGGSVHAHHLHDAMIVDGRDPRTAADAVERLVGDAGLRSRLQRGAVARAFGYSAEAAAVGLMEALLPASR